VDNQPHPGTPSAWRVIYPGTTVIVHRDTRQEVEAIASRAATTAIPQGYIPGIGWVPTRKISRPSK
jgi:hypothetical protein